MAGLKNDDEMNNSVIKTPTADVAREIMRRKNGYDPNPNINLAEYGLDENSNPEDVLKTVAQLNPLPAASSPDGPSGMNDADKNYSEEDNSGFVNNMKQIGNFVDTVGDIGNDFLRNYSDGQQNQNSIDSDSSDADDQQNSYQDILDRYVDEFSAIGDFQYDPDNPMAQYYDRSYRNAAELAKKNALAAGGTNYSSTKQALANSAYNHTISQLGDVQRQLYQFALDEYQTERSNSLQNIEMARTLKNDEDSQKYHEWYMNNTESEQERDQGNIDKDRQVSYASLAANYGNYDALSEITGLDFSDQKTRDSFNDAYMLYQATGSLDGFKNLGIDTSYIEQERQVEIAVRNATYGDYSGLEELGIDTTKLTRDDNVSLGLTLAQFGDYSFLEDALGVDLSAADYAYNLQIGLSAAEGGDYSYLEKMGFDTSKLRQNDALSLAVTAAEYGDFSKLGEILGVDLSDAQYAYDLQIGLAAAEGGDYSYLDKMGFDTSFMRQLNQKKLATGSGGSGGGSGSGGSGTKVKSLTDNNYKTALSAFDRNLEDFNDYCNYLLSQGYTEEQVYRVVDYVHDQRFSDELSYVLNGSLGIIKDANNFYAQLFK